MKQTQKPKLLTLSALFLTAVLLFGSLPATAVAPLFETEETPTPLYEIEARRERNVKHFMMSDGTIQAIAYGDAVHRKDASGNWQDIDNTLSLQTENGVSHYTTPDGRARFAQGLQTNQPFFTVEEEGHSLSFAWVEEPSNAAATSLQPIAGLQPISSAASVQNTPFTSTETVLREGTDIMTLDAHHTSIVYENVSVGVDLEYILTGNQIKENIVVNSPQEQYQYTFALAAKGLRASMQEDGSVLLSNTRTGETAYTIPAPFMVDANGVTSYAVSFTLTEQTAGVYWLTVTADPTWLNAANRAFPVVIDPILKEYMMVDTYIDSNYPDVKYGASSALYVSPTQITFVRQYEPTLPANAELLNAEMSFYYYYDSFVTSGSTELEAYQVTSSWTETNLSWNTAIAKTNMGMATTPLDTMTVYTTGSLTNNNPAIFSLDVTSIAEALCGISGDNYGIAIKHKSGTSPIYIISCEEGYTYRGYLAVLYEEPRLADGVYKFNNSYCGFYMDVANSGTQAGTPLIQEYGTAMDGNRDQLFKVTYINTDSMGYNYYTIRSMTNSALALSAPLSGSSRPATLESIGSLDNTTVPYRQKWAIYEHNGYYLIKNDVAATSNYLSMPPTNTAGGQLYTSSLISDHSMWTLEAYTGSPMEGITWTSFASSLDPGDTFTYQACMYSSVIGRNGPITYAVIGEDGNTTNRATVNSSTGLLTAKKPGGIRVTANVVGLSISAHMVATITGIPEGTYYIKNLHSGLYMQPDDDGSTHAEQHKFDAKNMQRWHITMDENTFYYHIQNVESGNYLTAYSATIADQNVLLEPKVIHSHYQAWTITWDSTIGGYRLSFRANESEATELVLALGYAALNGYGTEGLNIETRQISSALGRWELIDATTYAHATLYTKVYYDASAISEGEQTVEGLRNIYNFVATHFLENYNIRLELQEFSYKTELNCSIDCATHDSLSALCNGDCGSITYCSELHHKSASRLLTILPSDGTYFSIRFVGYNICVNTPTGHRTTLGKGTIDGYNSIISIQGTEVQSTIPVLIHELSHNFGLQHCDNTNCIMYEDILSDDATWCSDCYNLLYDEFDIYYTGEILT